MWSLPDINKLNTDAEAFKATLQHIVSTGFDEHGEPLRCNYAGDDCEGDVRATPYHDIFSDIPKGHIDLCERHYGYYGSPDEGFFECEGCNRTMIENYTWEMYVHYGNGEALCLNCWRESILADEDEWLPLTDDAIQQVGVSHVRAAKHLIAVGQDTPKELELVGNVEMDSFTGGKLRGMSYADPTPSAAIEDIRSLLRDAMERGKKRAILILDAAYQFSVSVGVYADADR